MLCLIRLLFFYRKYERILKIRKLQLSAPDAVSWRELTAAACLFPFLIQGLKSGQFCVKINYSDGIFKTAFLTYMREEHLSGKDMVAYE